jgi:hypothetical protein
MTSLQLWQTLTPDVRAAWYNFTLLDTPGHDAYGGDFPYNTTTHNALTTFLKACNYNQAAEIDNPSGAPVFTPAIPGNLPDPSIIIDLGYPYPMTFRALNTPSPEFPDCPTHHKPKRCYNTGVSRRRRNR